MSRSSMLIAVLALATSTAAHAQSVHAQSVHAQSGHAGHGPAPAPAPAAAPAAVAAPLADGEVLRVNRDTRKLRIRHGEIRALNMPPMTMEFEVTDPAMLDAVKVGDRMRFGAEERRGQYFVNRIEPVR